jgi:flagellar hook-basal body complex protein FliE
MIMIEPVTLGLRAIGAAQSTPPAGIGAIGEAPGANRASFADVLAGVARDGMQTMHAAEVSSFNGLAGKAGVQEVVSSVLAAERALQTAIAIRDKTVSAIQEITRMQI